MACSPEETSFIEHILLEAMCFDYQKKTTAFYQRSSAEQSETMSTSAISAEPFERLYRVSPLSLCQGFL